MLHSHFVLLVIFSFFVSAVLAGLLRDDPQAQLKVGLKLFGGFIATAP